MRPISWRLLYLDIYPKDGNKNYRFSHYVFYHFQFRKLLAKVLSLTTAGRHSTCVNHYFGPSAAELPF